MIFCGREHPIFNSFIESNIISETNIIDTTGNNTKGKFFSTNELKSGNKYFFHSELPLIDPSLDIEYVFNIEDQMTMFKQADNGSQAKINLLERGETDYIKYILEDKRCKKIVCHIEKMSQALPNLLKSEIIREKTVFENIGIKTQPVFEKPNKDEFVLLFTNSHHDWSNSFNLRGGYLLIKIIDYLSNYIPNLKVIIRSSVPQPFDIPLSKDPRIELYPNKLSIEEMDNLYRRADVFILPSIRVHSHSICSALSYGIPVITSNGWGNEQYIQHDYNGMVLQGFEKSSWHDDKIGCMEDYSTFISPNLLNHILEQLRTYIIYMYSQPNYLNTLKENARKTCLEKYSLLNWEKWKI